MKIETIQFWSQLEVLANAKRVVIDRPKGSHHPDYPGAIYPVDYGYLEGTLASDGEEIDVWIGSQVGQTLQGVFLTVDLIKLDVELKIVSGCSIEEIQEILVFLNTGSMSAIYLKRDGGCL